MRKGERLVHLDSVNFGILVPRMTAHQLSKRAEGIHKDLTSRRFDFGDGGALSVKISMGVATLAKTNGKPTKDLLDDLYGRSQKALDEAKMEGNHIQVAD